MSDPGSAPVEEHLRERGPRLVLGLGNPGPEYAATRHNVGFRVIGELARRRGLALREGPCRVLFAEQADILFAQPQTFMNRSGYAARCLVEHRSIAPADILVVYDDIHLPLGKLRVRPSGTPGGHRGMESMIECLCTSEIPRLRMGVALAEPIDGAELRDFVLEPFSDGEQEAVESMIGRAADACDCWLAEGVQTAMNRYNG
ncbi:MAG: aminoacyl-tRNA hydrolase [Acidobacteriota bacterium]